MIKRAVKNFRRNNSGQFGLWMGVAAFPVLAATSFAVDYSGAERGRIKLKAALDSASLAAVTNQTLTPEQRAAYAASYFEQNFVNSDDFVLTVAESGSARVELFAKGKSPVTISRAVGFEGLDISERSVAVLTKDDAICVLALDPTGDNTFLVTEKSKFNAPTCSVQINSSSLNAAYVEPGSNAVSKAFCTVGGAKGQYFPFVNTECSPVEDPYATMEGPVPGPCVYNGALQFKLEKNKEESIYGDIITEEIVSIVGDMITLSPGTYCNKLKVEGYNVTFLPGNYYMKDSELEFKKGASARADGVTFFMEGKKSKVKIESGSSLYIKAPETGNYAGIAFFQSVDMATGGKDIKMKPKRDKETKTTSMVPDIATSELKGGANMDILGTVYLPAQMMKIGDSGLGTRAPATSFIAYRVAFEGGSQIEIAMDHASVGLPTGPNSDSSARLLK